MTRLDEIQDLAVKVCERADKLGIVLNYDNLIKAIDCAFSKWKKFENNEYENNEIEKIGNFEIFGIFEPLGNQKAGVSIRTIPNQYITPLVYIEYEGLGFNSGWKTI